VKPDLVAVRGRDARVAGWLEEVAVEHRVSVLQGSRAVDPRRFGMPAQAWDWYVEGDPAGFGACLAALERVLLARAPGAWWVGDGQGAALVLALACCWAERIGGVIALDGSLPDLPEGALADAPMAGLPVFLLGGALRSAAQLEARGARVLDLRESAPVRRRRAASAR
jgi:hypothetical protein